MLCVPGTETDVERLCTGLQARLGQGLHELGGRLKDVSARHDRPLPVLVTVLSRSCRAGRRVL